MRNPAKSHKAAALLALALLVALPALGLDLSEAKSSGMVGELNTGYLGAVQSSGEADKLVASINKKRKEQYQKIAKKNGISLQAVEARAGQKAVEKTSPGAYINTGSGWQKK
jgi:uncharacterized protein YdbL (DUF1318 family)